jgi:hypothetical protein
MYKKPSLRIHTGEEKGTDVHITAAPRLPSSRCTATPIDEDPPEFLSQESREDG